MFCKFCGSKGRRLVYCFLKKILRESERGAPEKEKTKRECVGKRKSEGKLEKFSKRMRMRGL